MLIVLMIKRFYGELFEHGKIATPLDSREHFLDVVVSIYERYKDDVDGLDFSMPGDIDVQTGHIYTPGHYCITTILTSLNSFILKSICQFQSKMMENVPLLLNYGLEI